MHQYPIRSLPSVFDESGLDVESALTWLGLGLGSGVGLGLGLRLGLGVGLGSWLGLHQGQG